MIQKSTIEESVEMPGSEGVKRENNQEKDLDELCFPILTEEIGDIVSEVDFYPILADEIESPVKSEPAKAKKAEEAIRENKGGSEFVCFLAKELTEKLKKDHVEVTASDGSIESLFKLAIDYGEIDTNNAAKGAEYARQIAMKLRFQLMLREASNNEVVTDLTIGELTKELFGASSKERTVTDDEVISASSDIAEPGFNENPAEEVTEEETEEQTENDDVDEVEEDTETKHAYTQDDILRYMIHAPEEGGNGYDNLYDALKASWSIPKTVIKNGDKKEYVEDLEKIKAIEKKLSLNERILYACDYLEVGLLDENQFKRKKNGFLDVKNEFKDLNRLTLIVSDTKVICTSQFTSARSIRFDKSDVAAINGIFRKGGLLPKVSQIQVQLKNNKNFVINNWFDSKDEFDIYLNRFTDVMNR